MTINIAAKYNSDEIASAENYQIHLNTTVVWDGDEYAKFYTHSEETSDDGVFEADDDFIILVDGVLRLILEDACNCYRALHAYSVGHDGSHMSYSEINLISYID